MNSFNEVKRKQLELRRANLLEEYQATHEQLSRVLSATDQLKIKRTIAALETELQQIESELNQSTNAASITVPPKESVNLSPNELYQWTLKALSECEEFNSDNKLLTLFTHPNVKLYLNSIPGSSTRQGRVMGTMAVLKDSRRRDGRNGMALLLDVLRDIRDPNLALYQELDFLARCWDAQSTG